MQFGGTDQLDLPGFYLNPLLRKTIENLGAEEFIFIAHF